MQKFNVVGTSNNKFRSSYDSDEENSKFIYAGTSQTIASKSKKTVKKTLMKGIGNRYILSSTSHKNYSTAEEKVLSSSDKFMGYAKEAIYTKIDDTEFQNQDNVGVATVQQVKDVTFKADKAIRVGKETISRLSLKEQQKKIRKQQLKKNVEKMEFKLISSSSKNAFAAIGKSVVTTLAEVLAVISVSVFLVFSLLFIAVGMVSVVGVSITGMVSGAGEAGNSVVEELIRIEEEKARQEEESDEELDESENDELNNEGIEGDIEDE